MERPTSNLTLQFKRVKVEEVHELSFKLFQAYDVLSENLVSLQSILAPALLRRYESRIRAQIDRIVFASFIENASSVTRCERVPQFGLSRRASLEQTRLDVATV